MFHYFPKVTKNDVIWCEMGEKNLFNKLSNSNTGRSGIQLLFNISLCFLFECSIYIYKKMSHNINKVMKISFHAVSMEL
jgi:hypothetical protein